MDFYSFMDLNSTLHYRLTRHQCIKITGIKVDRGVEGGYLVSYIDYSTMSSDYASIVDIVNWVQWGERYVDNPGALQRCF